MQVFKIAIIGRENVGKSTLFNKLCQKEFSIVNNQPGITRDYIKHTAKLFDLEFELIDTAGWYLGKDKKDINYKIKDNILLIVEEADLIFFVVDAKASLSNEDLLLARKVRKLQKKVILLANKSESKQILSQNDLLKLGFGEAIFISAEHKMGFDDIYHELNPIIGKKFDYIEEKQDKKEISISIIGRPNVGKSTFFNAILGFERSLASDVIGTTRDHIIYKMEVFDTIINLIDTPGIRRKSRVHEKIEELSVDKTISAIKASDIVLLVMDSQLALEKQDLVLANLVLKYNKLLIPIINKKDLVNNIDKFKDEVNYLIEKRLPQIKGIELLYTNAKRGFYTEMLFRKIISLWELYQIKIPTSQLNSWLNQTLKTYNMPIVKNNIRLKIKYVKQSSTHPFSFLFFTNISNEFSVNQNFEKFLINSLREKFGLHGMQIKASFISSKNPFVGNNRGDDD